MKTIKLLKMAILCLTFIMVSCSDGEDGSNGADGAIGPAGPSGPSGQTGQTGADGSNGIDGINCWDLNGNGVADSEEDINGDSNVDVLDCQGADGTDGVDGANGVDGVDGTDGADGNANVLYTDYNISTFGGTTLVQNLGLTPLEVATHAFLFYLKDGTVWYSIPGPLLANNFYSRILLSEATSDLTIRFYETGTDNNYNVPVSTFDFLRVVRIELGGFGKNSEKDLMAQLKEAGVDTNDYNSVAAFFGL